MPFLLHARCHKIAPFPEDTSQHQGSSPPYPPKGAASAQSHMEKKSPRVNLLDQRWPHVMREGIMQEKTVSEVGGPPVDKNQEVYVGDS